MNEHPRAPKVVRMTPGAPLAPEPHQADYIAEIPEEVFAAIDRLCPQDELSGGRPLKRIEW